MPLTKDLRYPDMKIQTSGLTKFVPPKKISGAEKLQDFPLELIHHIQSLLPLPDAARTCILSRSWGHAWSTFPILRFLEWFICPKIERQYYNQIDRTLLRYHRDNIPIQRFFLDYKVRNKELDFLEKWIQLLVSPKICLKELSLEISVRINDSFTLPDEILYGQHLHTLTVTKNILSTSSSLWICNSNDALIKCVSLRVLDLTSVSISEQVLNNLLSTCCLLEKIKLVYCRGFKTIKFKNSPCFLRELKISTGVSAEDVLLEIDDVIPCLELFDYRGPAFSSSRDRPLPFNLDAIGGCVKHLHVAYVFMDDSFFNTINLKFPFLESMTIEIDFPGEESFVITSASLKRLTVLLWAKRSMMDIQVYAPKLLTLHFKGLSIVPRDNLSISYPITPPGQVTLTVNTVD